MKRIEPYKSLKHYLFLAFTLIAFNNSAQSFVKTLESTGSVSLWDFIKCRDGGFLVYGIKYYSTGNKSLIIKMDSMANLIWQKEMDLGNILYGLQNSVGGFYFTANDKICKTDSLGNTIWCKLYDYQYDHSAPKMFLLLQDDQVITGSNRILGSSDFETTIMRVDSSGNILWNKIFGTGTTARLYMNSGKLSPDSFIYVTGVCDNQSSLMKMDLGGNVHWYKTKANGPYEIDFVTSNEIVAVSQFVSPGPYKTAISKIDSTGSFLHSICLSSQDTTIVVDNLILVDDHTYEIHGRLGIMNSFFSRSFVLLMNDSSEFLYGSIIPDSNLVSVAYFGQNNCPDYFLLRKQGPTGPILSLFCHTDRTNQLCIGQPLSFDTIAYVDSFTASPQFVFGNETITISDSGISTPVNITSADYCNITTVESIHESLKAIVYPNPFSDQLTFELSSIENYVLSIYTSSGAEVLKKKFVSSFTFNSDDLKSGIYFFHIYSESGLLNIGKIIKL